MSLFQCHNCGCVENTATSCAGFVFASSYDWSGIEHLKGFKLCSACGPTRYADGTPAHGGKWHNRFPRRFLRKGMWKTNREGNLEHIETGETDYTIYASEEPCL